jgi:hypothetical protein
MRRLLAAALTLPLLVAPAAGATSPARTPAGVQLGRDPGSVVSAAEVALGPGTTRLTTDRYSMVGATWQGSAPAIAVRTAPGEPWLELPELADGPSVATGEGVPGLGATDLVWVGPDRDLEVRVGGTGSRDLELVLIDPGELPTDDDAPAARRTTGTAQAAPDRAPRPELRSRKDWDADPSWRNGRPRYNDRLQQVHVHHTATGNGYSRKDVPGILRGMYRYHTQNLGWFDIGYNFLVDRFGRGWVGRSGGAARLVRGAHTLGFNHTSVGVAMIGTLQSRRPWKPAVAMLARVAAWKLDKHGRDAVGKVRVRSTGSDKYAEGQRPRLPVIDGHRDTNDTACPGQKLYDRLPRVRQRAQARIDRFDP